MFGRLSCEIRTASRGRNAGVGKSSENRRGRAGVSAKIRSNALGTNETARNVHRPFTKKFQTYSASGSTHHGSRSDSGKSSERDAGAIFLYDFIRKNESNSETQPRARVYVQRRDASGGLVRNQNVAGTSSGIDDERTKRLDSDCGSFQSASSAPKKFPCEQHRQYAFLRSPRKRREYVGRLSSDDYAGNEPCEKILAGIPPHSEFEGCTKCVRKSVWGREDV